MIIVPKEELERRHYDAKTGLKDQFNSQLEKIINENEKLDKYWILGKVRFPKEHNGKVGRTFLQASLEKPPLVTDSFLYEVDNRKGCKTLLWVMHPGKKLRIPTLNKTICIENTGASNSVAAKTGRRQKRA